MNNAQNMFMEVTDLSGKLVSKEIKSLNQGENKISIYTEHLSNGIYTVSLSSGSTSFTRKMVVQ